MLSTKYRTETQMITNLGNVKCDHTVDARFTLVPIELLHADKTPADRSILLPGPVTEQDEPRRYAAVPSHAIKSRGERGATFSLNSAGTLSEDDNGNVACLGKALKSGCDALEHLCSLVEGAGSCRPHRW